MYLIWNLMSILLAYTVNFFVFIPGLILVSLIHGFYPIRPLEQLWELVIKVLITLSLPLNMLSVLIGFYIVIATASGLIGFVAGYFPPTRFIQRMALGFRIPSPEQLDKIRAAMDYISERSGMNFTGKFNYYVQSDPNPNALASGKNDITVTTGAIQELDVPLLAGVLAHEMGHHAHGDTRTLLFINGISYLSMLSITLIRIANYLLLVLRYIPFLNFVAAIFVMFLNICLMVAVVIQRIPYAFFNVFCSRQIENAADAYTVRIGMGEEFIAAMQWILARVGEVPWYTALFTDHPRTKSRISHVRKLMEKQKMQAGTSQ